MFDLLIIGSGAAGLGLALSLADRYRIALISKTDLLAGSSARAQGGIAAVMNASDSVESHIEDTLIAGAGLCDRATVEFVVRNAKTAIDWLIDHGVQFSLDENREFHLTREGGHSHRRVLHAADKTGSAIVQTLGEQVIAHPNITVFSEYTAIDLVCENNRCYGAMILNNLTEETEFFSAKITVLATGGASKVYLHTSNPDQTTGDGMAMAHRAGCKTSHLEFNQFHPTTLFHPEANGFLISEAVRGEGGVLKLPNGDLFMHKYDSRGELAPRDIVTRAIDTEMKNNNIDCVFLDISDQPANKIKNHFPTIYEKCLSLGIDMTKQAIPVVPAAHYTCGGVVTDLSAKTNINYLYAIGEVASTGLHGANRMASNSLLECLVFAMSAAKAADLDLKNLLAQEKFSTSQTNNFSETSDPLTKNKINEIKSLMWQHVGITRSEHSLTTAKKLLQPIKQEIEAVFNSTKITPTLIEARNMATVAELIINAAISRKESLGLHFLST